MRSDLEQLICHKQVDVVYQYKIAGQDAFVGREKLEALCSLHVPKVRCRLLPALFATRANDMKL